MARTNDSKTNQWKRLDLDTELTGLVQGLSVLSGAPPVISPPAALSPGHGKISPLLGVDGAVECEVKDKENMKAEIVEVVKEISKEN